MRYLIPTLLVLLTCCVATASANDLDNSPPEKTDHHILQNPAGDDRDGGETIETAVPIPGLPFYDTGATCDNIDNYDEICPYTGSMSPDVVYSWEATFDGELFIDLCGSLYDTKVYMYGLGESGLYLVDCNDDYYFDDICGQYVSAIEDAPVILGETYYVVVDGYGGDCGSFILGVEEAVYVPPCELICNENAMLEGEPPLVDGYEDTWNGGCNSLEPVFQWLDCPLFCGVAGWYVSDEGYGVRDTDWLECTALGGTVTWTVDAESSTNCYQLSIPDCDTPSVLLSNTVGPCEPATMTINTTPGEIVHLWVGSANFSNPGDVPGNEYDYIFEIDGIVGTSATSARTWSAVKSLYR